MTPIVFLDTETTSLNRWHRRIWEIAMIRRDAFGQREMVIQVGDVNLADADPASLAISGFYQRHRLYTVDPDPTIDYELMVEGDAAKLIEAWVRGTHIVGAVPNFDEHSLQEMFRRHGLLWSAHYHLIDIEAVAVGYLYGKGRAVGEEFVTELPWKSDDLSRACGVEPPTDEERHTGMGDARWAMRWYDKITGSMPPEGNISGQAA